MASLVELLESSASPLSPHVTTSMDVDVGHETDPQKDWSALECLILGQFVCKFGVDDMATTSKSMRALIGPQGLFTSRLTDAFSVRACTQKFQDLLQKHDLAYVPMEQQKGNTSVIPAPTQLIRILFQERMHELRQEIEGSVDRIQNLAEECMAIEEGSRDEELSQKLTESAHVMAGNVGMSQISETDRRDSLASESSTGETLQSMEHEPKIEDTEVLSQLVQEQEEKLQDVEVMEADEPQAQGDDMQVDEEPLPEEGTKSNQSSPRRSQPRSSPTPTLDFGRRSSVSDQEDRTWRKMMMPIFEEVANHRRGPLFKNGVRDEDAPGYHRSILRPLDLTSIRQRLRDGTLKTTAEFHRDLLMMVQNAIMFNKEGTAMHRYACELYDFIEEKMRAFRQTEQLIRRNSVQSG